MSLGEGVSILVYGSAVASPADGLFIGEGFVYAEGGVVRRVGEGEPPAELEAAELVVGGRGRLVVPGLVSAHTHLLLYPLRHHLPHGDPASTELAERLASSITAGEAYTLASLALYELTMHGVTVVAAMDPYAEHVARAMRDASVRGVVAVPMPGCRYSSRAWREELEALLEWRGVGVALAACTRSDVEEAVRVAREKRIPVYGHPPEAHLDPRVDVSLHGGRGGRRVEVPVPGGRLEPREAGLGLDAVGIGNPLRLALVAAWQGMGYEAALNAVTAWGCRTLGAECGVLKEGAPADLIVFDLSTPPGLPARRETLARLLLDAEPRVEMVVAGGQPLVDQGTHLLIQPALVERGLRLAERLVEELTRA